MSRNINVTRLMRSRLLKADVRGAQDEHEGGVKYVISHESLRACKKSKSSHFECLS